jgi:hypothetical protein
VLKRKSARKIFVSKRELGERRRKVDNEELYTLYSSPDTLRGYTTW